jgi:uncharacterized membrane protein
MSSTSILSVCIAAFVLIFLLLTVLSVMMRALTLLFPPIETRDRDSATVAAIEAAYNSIYPDRKITGIKETTK